MGIFNWQGFSENLQKFLVGSIVNIKNECFLLGSLGINRSTEQTNCSRTALRFTRFVVPRSDSFPTTPPPKKKHSFLKWTVLSLSPFFHFRSEKQASNGRFSSFWIFLHYGAHLYGPEGNVRLQLHVHVVLKSTCNNVIFVFIWMCNVLDGRWNYICFLHLLHLRLFACSQYKKRNSVLYI